MMQSFEFLFFIALLLYSFVIFTHRLTKELCPWMVWLFGIAVIADIGGTLFLCVGAATQWTFTLHTISGLLSLLIMTLHFVWALLAVTITGQWKAYFNRFSMLAWGLWLTAFISGFLLKF